MNKLLTIVICTYNGEAYLSEVIESILSQEGLGDIVHKILVVDNASTDKTKEIVTKYMEENPIIDYIYESNKGVSNARKHAANVITPWVAYVDDDNILLPRWLINNKKYIEENPTVGVINGASIPLLRFQPTENQKKNLKIIYPNLACTHYDYNEYIQGIDSKLKFPFGAGMILRTKEIENFLDKGWTRNVGRSGEELGSGEDGEIAYAVLKEGYDYGFNMNAALWHIIPQRRLENDYINKLYKGLDIGYYKYVSYSDNYLKRRISIVFRFILGILVHPLRIILTNDPIKKEVLRKGLVSKIRFIKLSLKDLIVFRRS
ncbi:glycosyltransferase [Chryseomicrobium palamuruense]|uniref:Glycosyltransferase n=1 Tax=Chryseomicrobium palamuruense TaxID=682973 RepID=A0ABV8UUJ2_9BACL